MISREPVFLDRDGVINRNRPDYVRTLSQWIPLPGAFQAISRLCGTGHPVIVVTNQSGIGRGLFPEENLLRIHGRMESMLHEAGGSFAGVYHCPHRPESGCLCRKPETGMIDRARRELKLASGGWIVGDAETDMELGRRAGLKTVLVLTGRGRSQYGKIRETGAPGPDHVSQDLTGAVELILSLSRA